MKNSQSYQISYNNSQKQAVAVIVGGGPAGLTAAYELLARSEIHPLVFEESDNIGGISRTEYYKGNRIDIGGHRFFSKSQRVAQWWEAVMPTDKDPQTNDRTMMRRRRVSRIYYLRRFFDYPVTLSWLTLRNLGFSRTVSSGFSYLKSSILKRRESSLEDFYINRFGKKLYSMFFEDYTEKVWGVHPSELGAQWGAQRVKGLSLLGVLQDMLRKQFCSKSKRSDIETSLIKEFLYPKYGPGQLWEAVAEDIQEKRGCLEKNTTVKKVFVDGKRVVAVEVEDSEQNRRKVDCDFLLSSMPLKELIASIEGVEIPTEVKEAAAALPYRDFITVGLLVDKLKIRNETKLETFKNRVPDTWIYVQEREVKLGRIQIFNNWSPYMVADYENKMWIGLEYFCSEGDELWQMSDSEFINMAIAELEQIDVIERGDVEDAVRIRVKKAYPAYYGSYAEMPEIRRFLNSIENLYCIGRNGQHRYNNMDHSMLTAMTAVDAILSGVKADKDMIWDVNTEEKYHESNRICNLSPLRFFVKDIESTSKIGRAIDPDDASDLKPQL